MKDTIEIDVTREVLQNQGAKLWGAVGARIRQERDRLTDLLRVNRWAETSARVDLSPDIEFEVKVVFRVREKM